VGLGDAITSAATKPASREQKINIPLTVILTTNSRDRNSNQMPTNLLRENPEKTPMNPAIFGC